EIAHAVSAVREERSAQAVTISAAHSFAVRWLLFRLPAFKQAPPRLEVSLVVERGLDDPEPAGIDLAVRMGSGPWPEARSEPLMDDSLYPVMSPAYWKKAARPGAS